MQSASILSELVPNTVEVAKEPHSLNPLLISPPSPPSSPAPLPALLFSSPPPLLPGRLYLSNISTAIISPKTRILHTCSACYCSPALFPSTPLCLCPSPLSCSPASAPLLPLILSHLLVPVPSHSASPHLHSRCTGLLHLRQCLA